MNWYLKAFKNYSTFTGRAQRSEYWFFTLFYFLGLFIIVLVSIQFDSDLISNTLTIGFVLIHILPYISVTVRRLHDTNRSGWWYFLNLIPYIGPFILLFLLAIDSKEDNKYGLNPKQNASGISPIN